MTRPPPTFPSRPFCTLNQTRRNMGRRAWSNYLASNPQTFHGTPRGPHPSINCSHEIRTRHEGSNSITKIFTTLSKVCCSETGRESTIRCGWRAGSCSRTLVAGAVTEFLNHFVAPTEARSWSSSSSSNLCNNCCDCSHVRNRHQSATRGEKSFLSTDAEWRRKHWLGSWELHSSSSHEGLGYIPYKIFSSPRF